MNASTTVVVTVDARGFRETVARHAASLKDVLRFARSRATKQQTVEYVRALAKSVLSSIRCKAVEIVVALVVDLAQRGSLEDAESVGLQLAAIARAEHPSTDPELSIAEAQIAEQLCEGDCNAAESRMAYAPSISNLLAYLASSARHRESRRVLDAAVRKAIAKEQAA